MDETLAGLKPGAYLQTQNGIKSLNTLGDLMLGTNRANPSIETLAAIVGYLWIALNKRKQMLAEIPHKWMDGETEIDAPLGMDDDQLQRIDEAIQLYSSAFFFKARSRIKTLGLIWYDPASMSIDDNLSSLTSGIVWRRSDKTGNRVTPSENLLVLARWGMRELQLAPSAASATKAAAEILESLQSMTDTAFDMGVIRPKIIVVPPSTSLEERKEISTLLDRVVNRVRKNRRQQFVSVSSEVQIQELSFMPSELGKLDNVEMSAVRQVLAAHDVPESFIFGNASNFATAGQYDVQFVRTMAQRLQWIADKLNEDKSFGTARLEVYLSQHEAIQASELEKAEALQRLTGKPIMTINEARERLELEPVQGGDVLADEYEQSAQPAQPAQVDEMPDVDANAKSAAFDMEARQFRTWYKNRMGSDPADFNANHLTHADKLTIADELLRLSIKNYP